MTSNSRTILPATLALATCLLAGCNSGNGGREFTEDDDVDNVAPIVAHDHSSGPHEGHLVVFGDEAYHGEIVFDEAAGELTVYIIKADATTAHPIDQEAVEVHLELDGEEVELTLPASPDTGDPDGTSSRFVLGSEDVPDGIQDAEDLHGHIVATIDGEEYEGEITHDHGHDHAHSHEHEQADDGDAAHEHEHADDEASGEHEHSHDEAAETEDEGETEGEATEQ